MTNINSDDNKYLHLILRFFWLGLIAILVGFKRIVHPKMYFSHPHVVLNPYDLLSFVKDKGNNFKELYLFFSTELNKKKKTLHEDFKHQKDTKSPQKWSTLLMHYSKSFEVIQ